MTNKELIRYLNFEYLGVERDRSYYPKTSFSKIIVRFFLKIVKYFLDDLKNFKFYPKFDGKVVFISLSINNEHSMYPVYDDLSLPKKFFGHYSKSKQDKHYIPKFIPAFFSIFYLFKAIGFYRSLNAKDKKNFCYGDTDILFTYGFLAFYKRIFKKQKPIAIIESNHDIYYPRILIHLAKKHKVPTFHIPHACEPDVVSEIIESFALVEGEDTRQKYLNAGSQAEKLIMIGMPKLDAWSDKINKKTTVDVIGYAINGTENHTLVIEDTRILSENFPNAQIILRPHPMQYTPSYYKKTQFILNHIQEYTNLTISDPRQEGPFAYINKIDVLIAGDSSIHLEASILNVFPVYYDNTAKFIDHYGFVKNKLTSKADTIQDVVSIIQQIQHDRPYVRNNAKQYVATIDTQHDGKSSQLATQIIEDKIAHVS